MRYSFIAAISQNDFSIPQNNIDNTSFANILQVVFGIAGGVALVVLLLAALKYVLSRGDPAAVAKSKNAILYAIIGLAICAAAFSIVSFVVKSV